MERRLVLRDPIERGDETRHGILVRWTRAMRRGPMHRHMLPEGTLLGDTDAVIGEPPVLEFVVAALGDEVFNVFQQVAMPLDKSERTGAVELFVGIRDEDDVAIERHPAALERNHGLEMRDALALHVERTTSPHVAVPDRAGERIDA